ncbi:MAG: CRTAC1 family protein [Candidatus Cloacimonetes bacterium]|nr:CRTAC1 family protein [Candidatus Cloacimonadota bacterium]
MKFKVVISMIIILCLSVILNSESVLAYDSLTSLLEKSIEDSVKYGEIKSTLCDAYPTSEIVYKFANEDFYNEIYPIWQNDSLKVLAINKLLAKYPQTNWRRTMYQHLTFSLYNLKKEQQLLNILADFRAAFPDDYLPYYLSARYYLDLDLNPQNTLKFAEKAHEIVYKYSKLDFFPVEEWQLEKRSAPVKTAVLLAEIYFKQDNYHQAELILNHVIQNNDLGINDETNLSRCYYWSAKVFAKLNKKETAVQFAIDALIAGDSRNYYTPRADSLLRSMLEYIDLTEDEYQNFILTQSGYNNVTFSDITDNIGLANVSASRVAWGDYNGDGYQDILLDGNRLFKNMEAAKFIEVTKAAFKDTIKGNGGLWGDFDNDGDFDVVTKDPESVWLNNAGSFTKIITSNSISDNKVSTEGIGIGDVDLDGYLDIYFANYEKQYVNEEDQFFRGIGSGEFLEITARADLLPKNGKNRAGRGVNMSDFDLDNDLDIYVSNYRLTDNFLWQNDGTGHFKNTALEYGIAGEEVEGWWGHTIGSEWADVDNDGDFDLITCNLAHPRYIDFSNKTKLYINENGVFIDKRGEAGIKYEETHSEPCWADFNNDGFLDLYITSIYEGRRSFLYLNNRDGTFFDATFLAGVRHFNGWGAACADYDNDGDQDLIVAGGSIQLFQNETKGKNWILVSIQGKEHSDAIGTKIVLHNSEISLLREIQGGKGTTNQHSIVQHFGLGEIEPPFTLDVTFPNGRMKTMIINKINTVLKIKE